MPASGWRYGTTLVHMAIGAASRSTPAGNCGRTTAMRNLEVKARCADLETVRELAERLGARSAGTFRQRDAFFTAPEARLKLRVTDEGDGQLIAYRRDDAARPRDSEYLLYATSRPAELHAVLAHAL